MPNNELDIELLDNNDTVLDIELLDNSGGNTTTIIKARDIINEIGNTMPMRSKIRLDNLKTTDNGLDETIVKIDSITNTDLESMLK